MQNTPADIADLLILTFPPGSSLSRWERFGVIDREMRYLEGISQGFSRLLFVSTTGSDERRIAAQLGERLGKEVAAISDTEPDPDLGPSHTLLERVIASVNGARSVIIQTMQFDDAGIATRLLNPLRRTGARVALVAKGTFIESRVFAGSHGPHHFRTLAAGDAERNVCSNAQLVITTSPAMTDEMCWKYGLNPERTRVISQHVAHNEMSLKRQPDLIVTSGRFTGDCSTIRTAIDAVALLTAQQRETISLEIIGDGPMWSEMAEYAEQKEVRAHFHRGITHSELIDLLSRATVYIQPEAARRQSYTVLEAMALGCPVVVTDIPEYNGLVQNGHTGIRVNPDADAFRFATDCLLGDRSFREMLGEAAHQQIYVLCSIERIILETLKSYADAMKVAPEKGGQQSRMAG